MAAFTSSGARTPLLGGPDSAHEQSADMLSQDIGQDRSVAYGVDVSDAVESDTL